MATKAKTTAKTTTKTTTKSAKTTTTKSAASTTAKKAAAPRKRTKSISDDEVARQAYMLWLEKGGSELENWLEAERQLR